MKCMDEGALQAYLDNELPEAEMSHAAGHLEGCADCRERLARLEATVKRVGAWLNALEPEQIPAVPDAVPRMVPRPARHHLPWALLAASLALFFALNRSSNTPVPAAEKEPAAPPALAAAPIVEAPRIRSVRKPKPAAPLGDFVPFDDAGPMQVGMVVRVMVPVSDTQQVAADVVIGEDGRARAIRFVE